MILIAEDEPMIQELFKAIFKKDHKTIIASNGKEAVEIFKKDPSIVCFAVLDYMMPVMNGHEAHDLIREIKSDIPIIFCSGYSPEGKMVELLKQENNYFIQKPFEITDWIEKAKKLCPGLCAKN